MFLALFFILFLECAIKWTFNTFYRVNLDEISLVINSGTGGMDAALLASFIKKVIFRALGWAIVLTATCYFMRRRPAIDWLVFIVVSVLLLYRLYSCNIQTGSFFSFSYSNFYEEHYVDPNSANIVFPRKRNVVLIALESIEKSYANQEIFGTGGLTPNITRLENENISFQAYNSLSGLSHTIAAITGMTTGLPMFYTNFKNIDKMLGASGIGSVFTKNGYQTWAIFPASGKFSRKAGFMKRMGFEQIYDGERLKAALGRKLAVEPFHGVDDYTMFEQAKPMIDGIVKSDQPYFIFMETVNTHCDGYFTQACIDMGFAQETQHDIVKCDDKIIYDFVQWMRARDPGAVIILINDHTMNTGELKENLAGINPRPLANVFINADIFNGVDTTRPVAAFDFFPTTLEAAGAHIDGCRLGLGTALSTRCAKTKTLREKYGDKMLEKYMEQRNKLYYKLAAGK